MHTEIGRKIHIKPNGKKQRKTEISKEGNMTTLDQLKKHYDKLTTRERFALIMAADARGDTSEAKALARAAPRKTFQFANIAGLQEGFEFVAMMHIMSQLGHAAGFYWMMLVSDASPIGDKPLAVNIGGELFTEDRAIELLHRNIIGGRDAFRMLCEEYKLSPADILQRYPFVETVQIGEALVRVVFEQDEPTEVQRAELETYTRETLEAYRAAIAHYTDGWE
jgi:hypothetical protein